MSGGVTGVDRPVATIRLYLYVENNNRHLRGKKRAIDAIARFVLPVYGETRHLQRNEYQIKIPYRDDAETRQDRGRAAVRNLVGGGSRELLLGIRSQS